MFALFAVAASGSEPHSRLDAVVVLDGSGHEDVRDVAATPDGGIVAVGGTDSADFPVTFSTFAGGTDAFVVRLDADGRVVWARTMGGPDHDRAYAVEIDPDGNIVIGGRAGRDFPVTEGAFQTTFMGGQPHGPYQATDGMVAKLSPDGEVIFASYFGATDLPDRIVRDLDVDASGDIWLAASTHTGRYPLGVLAAFDRPLPPRTDLAVLARIAGDGSRVRWARAFGGDGEVWGVPSVRVEADGTATYLTNGSARGLPTTPGAISRAPRGGIDFHLSRWSPSGDLVWGTYLGGSDLEQMETHHLAVAPDRTVVIAAGTASKDYPTTEGALDRTHNGNGRPERGFHTNYPGDAVVSRISADGRTLLASTLIGGSEGESAEGVVLDAAGNVAFSGATFSKDIPIVNAITPWRARIYDAWVVVLSPGLDRLLMSSPLGPAEGAVLRTATRDRAGRLWFAGNLRPPGEWAAAGRKADRDVTTAAALVVRLAPLEAAAPDRVSAPKQ